MAYIPLDSILSHGHSDLINGIINNHSFVSTEIDMKNKRKKQSGKHSSHIEDYMLASMLFFTRERSSTSTHSSDRWNLYLFDIDFEPESEACVCTHDNCVHTSYVSLSHSIVHHLWAAMSIFSTANMHFNFIFSSFAATFDETKYANQFFIWCCPKYYL